MPLVEAPAIEPTVKTKCDHCGQKIQQTHKEMLTKHKLTILKVAAQHVMSTGVNDFRMRDMGDFTTSPSDYNNFSKLRFHGLITPVKDKLSDRKIKGRWLITRNGWAFLRGELDIPKYVMVRNNSVQSRSDARISVRDVFYGSEVIQTTFEYFDDAGKPVGVRPLLPSANNKQLSLA